jgi:hypothetical protein
VVLLLIVLAHLSRRRRGCAGLCRTPAHAKEEDVWCIGVRALLRFLLPLDFLASSGNHFGSALTDRLCVVKERGCFAPHNGDGRLPEVRSVGRTSPRWPGRSRSSSKLEAEPRSNDGAADESGGGERVLGDEARRPLAHAPMPIVLFPCVVSRVPREDGEEASARHFFGGPAPLV